jgi:hypothetical protein
VPADSESAEATPARRGGVPRWILEVWLWVTFAPVALFEFGCNTKGTDLICTGLTNWGWPIWASPPGAFEQLFLSLWRSVPAAVGATAVLTAICHLLVRRFVPRRVGWGWMVLAYLVGLLVGWATLFTSFYFELFATHMSFWAYLRSA